MPLAGLETKYLFGSHSGNWCGPPQHILCPQLRAGLRNSPSEVTPIKENRPGQASYRTITGYSSTVDQCDDTPFITASNTRVRDGIVASNEFPFGTRLLLPQLVD
ncbi:hypothetical protein LCGC14_1745220 [marine sediment metagenome]|uniref:Uncharacterized protein n=1 Tax=marine sediment metagenome TaxID=412755 RepID=A0A0F9K534_9ZZZZ|nr:hypothetical protein [Candidatus Scalindua sp.]